MTSVLTPKQEFRVLILEHLEALGLATNTDGAPLLLAEYHFHKTRDWRFDFAIPEINLAFEYEGFGKGHLTRAHYSKDCEKYTWASILGWTLVRITEKLVSEGVAGPLIRNAINFRIDPNLALPFQRPLAHACKKAPRKPPRISSDRKKPGPKPGKGRTADNRTGPPPTGLKK